MTIDTFADERDFKLLEQDRFTFFVLKRVLALPCELILSDHERLIICLSSNPFPVWIWTADDATPQEMEKAYQLMKEKGYLDGSHTFNMKYELAEFFIKKTAEESSASPHLPKLSIKKNMFAYDNPKPLQPASATSIDAHKHTVFIVSISPKHINPLVVYPIAPLDNILITTVDDNVTERLELLELHLMADMDNSVFVHHSMLLPLLIILFALVLAPFLLLL